MSLLDIAQNRKHKRQPSVRNLVTDEHIELAIAWANDQVSYADATFALTKDGKATMQTYVWLARSLREAIQRGLLTPTKKEITNNE